jgi:hypothetical protein
LESAEEDLSSDTKILTFGQKLIEISVLKVQEGSEVSSLNNSNSIALDSFISLNIEIRKKLQASKLLRIALSLTLQLTVFKSDGWLLNYNLRKVQDHCHHSNSR